jgi:uncharacterized small protein (DUF1192 family)
MNDMNAVEELRDRLEEAHAEIDRLEAQLRACRRREALAGLLAR